VVATDEEDEEPIAVLTTVMDAQPDNAPLDPLDPLSKQAPPLPCRTQNSDLWFAESPVELEMAKAFCRECPAMQACLAGALERRELWGVWGGEIFDRGRVLPRKRPRGRPRKHERPGVAA
jgi:WhiB family transcriptional regulator, redox-sensing transcriptional regulator